MKRKLSTSRLMIFVGLASFIILAGMVYGLLQIKGTNNEVDTPKNVVNGFELNKPNKHRIPFEKIVSGGPGRDGIPAIDNPKFTTINNAKNIPSDGLGIFVDINGDQRYYPYSILVHHEIVNDIIDDNPVSVTFCPLCGSAVVYRRVIGMETVRFGVSGLLYESNLLMYDEKTESLWSQSLGEAVVGEQTGAKLERLPTQLLKYTTVKRKYPKAIILSTNTGYKRDYTINPYGSYDENDQLYFSVSVDDQRLPTKTIMYVIPLGENSVAFEQLKLLKGQTRSATFFGKRVTASKNSDGEIKIQINGEEQYGYFEMWFSWATQHKDDGKLWSISK